MATPMEAWVEEAARLTKPDKVVYCDGSEAENQGILQELLRQGDTFALNEKTYPNCYLHRSNPERCGAHRAPDLYLHARKRRRRPHEQLDGSWRTPNIRLARLLDGAMRGRTMYVVPYIMGPADSPISKVGVEVTDSPYVVASMRIMSRMGKVAMDRTGKFSATLCRDCIRWAISIPMRRFIVHFPEEKLIWSVGSGYGGNALLGKKCFALRIASCMAREAGLDGRAHADPGTGITRRKSDVHGRGISQRLRQNESGDDGFRAGKPGLSRLDRGRRHRLDADWARTAICTRSIRKRDFLAWRPEPG